MWYQQIGLVGGASVLRPPERGTGAENVRNSDKASAIEKFIFRQNGCINAKVGLCVNPRVGIN